MPNICGYLEGQVESAQKNLEVQQGEARALLGPKTQVQLKKTKRGTISRIYGDHIFSYQVQINQKYFQRSFYCWLNL